MGVFLFIIIIVGLVTFGEVVTKWLEQGASRPQIDPGREGEVARLREQVESLSARVDRLSEEQRFMTRLLESRPPGSSLPTSGEPRSERTDPPGGG